MALYVRCRSCGLYFNSGLPEQGMVKGQERYVLACPMGHMYEYAAQELVEETAFERRARRVAGRLLP